MAVTALKGGLWIPPPYPVGAAPSFASLLMDATGEKVAMMFEVPKTGTLDKFEFQAGTVTVNAASVIRCSFQDVDPATGDPDGTVDQYRGIAGSAMVSGGWNVPGLITSDGTDTGVKRAVTRGSTNWLAAVIDYSTFTAADIVNVSTLTNFPTIVGMPYADHFTAAWAKTSNYPVLALKYDDGTYEYLGVNVWPITAVNSISISSTTTPDEVGLIFQLPGPVTAAGAWVIFNSGATGRNTDIVLYDSDGTSVLETVTIDSDVGRSNNALNTFTVRFPTSRALLGATNYRLVVKPATTGNRVMHDVTISAAAIMDALPGGQLWHRTERTDAGAWTQTTTKRPLMGLLVDGIDDAAGGGGVGRLVSPTGLAA